MSAIEKLTYSISEAAAVSGLSISKLYKLSARRELPLVKIGSRVLIPRWEFEAWLKKFTVGINK